MGMKGGTTYIPIKLPLAPDIGPGLFLSLIPFPVLLSLLI